MWGHHGRARMQKPMVTANGAPAEWLGRFASTGGAKAPVAARPACRERCQDPGVDENQRKNPESGGPAAEIAHVLGMLRFGCDWWRAGYLGRVRGNFSRQRRREAASSRQRTSEAHQEGRGEESNRVERLGQGARKVPAVRPRSRPRERGWKNEPSNPRSRRVVQFGSDPWTQGHSRSKAVHRATAGQGQGSDGDFRGARLAAWIA